MFKLPIDWKNLDYFAMVKMWNPGMSAQLKVFYTDLQLRESVEDDEQSDLIINSSKKIVLKTEDEKQYYELLELKTHRISQKESCLDTFRN